MQSGPLTPPKTSGWRIDLVLAGFGFVICLAVGLTLYLRLAQVQLMWPLPALYFLEMMVVSLLGAGGLYLRQTNRVAWAGSWLPWAVTGILFGFSVMGAWSVGFFYVPAGLAFLVVAIRSTRPELKYFAGMAWIGMLAALAQAGLMVAVASRMYS